MGEKLSLLDLSTQAKKAYEAGDFAQAAALFESAAGAFAATGDIVYAAEMANNRSVALLQGKDAQGALEAARGTETVFQQAGDVKRQAIALANQAAAQDALGNNPEALRLYETSNDLLKGIGENDMRSYVLKSIAALQLRSGKQLESLASMQASIENKKKPSLKERFFKLIFKTTFKS